MSDAGQKGLAPSEPDILDSSQAGAKVIRGGAVRAVGYGLTLLLGLASVSLLTRHLGVVEFGYYVTVGSLIMIVTIVSDAGLTAVGVREYAIRDPTARRSLMRNLLAVRMLVTLIGVLGAIAFAILSGYRPTLVAGTVLGGFGLLFTIAQHTYTIPLVAELRLGLATALDLLRQALTVVGIVVLVLAGAGLAAFFAIPIPVGIAVLAVTVVAIRTRTSLPPAFERAEWRYLLAETVPAAAASTLNQIFYRVAIIMMSLIASGAQTGYFSASFRVIEALIAVPALLVGAAYPVLSRAAETDRERLAYGLQRMFDVCLILGAWMALSVSVGARPAIDLIGGREFEPAIPVLRIQGLALAATFFVTLWAGTLWVLRAKRQLVVANLSGVVMAATLTGALVPVGDAQGAALAMTIAEVLLALWLGIALMHGRPELRPALGTLPKVVAALAVGATVALAPLPDAVALLLANAGFFAVLLMLGGIPQEIWDALKHRRGALADTLTPPAR